MTQPYGSSDEASDRRPREELDDAGMSDDAAAVAPPAPARGNAMDDGVPVGAADAGADAQRSGADRRDG